MEIRMGLIPTNTNIFFYDEMNFTHCLCGLPLHVCQGAQADMHTWSGTNPHCRHLRLNTTLRIYLLWWVQILSAWDLMNCLLSLTMALHSSASLLTLFQNDTKPRKCREMWRFIGLHAGFDSKKLGLDSQCRWAEENVKFTCPPMVTFSSIPPCCICTGQSLGLKLPFRKCICNP